MPGTCANQVSSYSCRSRWISAGLAGGPNLANTAAYVTLSLFVLPILNIIFALWDSRSCSPSALSLIHI